ncbi:hypothetical protein GCM10028895_18290 [Pontibacter rugosus]
MLKTASTLKLVILFLLITCLAACNEDTIEPNGEGILSGQVLDADSGKPLAAVSIATTPATTAIITDAEGRFRISDITGGDYSITAKKSGYKTESVSVAVKDDKETAVIVQLSTSTEGNGAPGIPSEPSPANNTSGLSNSVTLKWKGPASKDTLTYDVYLYESGGNQKKIAESVKDTSVVADNLMHGTTYFWQVVAKNKGDATTNGPIWSFSTNALPNARYLFARSVDGNYDIYSSDGTTQNTFRLTTGFSRDWWPLLNPKRDIIAYSSDELTQPHIYTMNRDGSNKFKVTTVPIAGYHNTNGRGFAWSPDGGRLIYANYGTLYSIRRDGADLTTIATAPANRNFLSLDWTENGNKILALTIGENINHSEIYIMNADGTNQTLLVENLPGRIESPVFSIDGRSILYTRDISGFENAVGRQLDARIFRKNIDGTALVDLSANKPAGTNDLYPRYSPTGDKIIFVNVANDGMGTADIYMMDAADGKNRVKIFSNAIMPDWK